MAKSTLIVSQRGQVTLPAEVRKRLGIKEGGVLTLEERGEEIVLRPATVLEVEIYSDEQIADWGRDDELGEAERQRLKAKLARGR